MFTDARTPPKFPEFSEIGTASRFSAAATSQRRSGNAQCGKVPHKMDYISITYDCSLGFGFFYRFLKRRFRISIAVQNDGQEFENSCSSGPDLPVGKKADTDRKFPGGSKVGGDPP